MNINTYQGDFENILSHLKEDLSGIRSGRANSAMVEGIQVDAYGAKTPLKGIASISLPDAKTILIEPWDKSIIKEVEKAILNSGKNLNPANEGTFLRISIASLTEESRKELLKLINEKTEGSRIRARQLRDNIKDEILEAEDKKEITEDERFKLQDELDKKIAEFNDKMKKLAEEKEAEIMKV